MATQKPIAKTNAGSIVQATIHQIKLPDLKDVLAKGIDDFMAHPTHLIFLIAIYPILTFVFAFTAANESMLPLVFPLLAGFTLLGPLVASGMYEISRRRERGEPVSRWHVFAVLKTPAILSLATLGVASLAIYLVWLGAALSLYTLIFGDAVPATVGEFARQVLTTGEGWILIVAGSAVGLVFAVAALSISAVSFPLLLDRDVGAAVAVFISVRVVVENPITMAFWGAIVVASLLVACLPVFTGLAVALPVLGHATWHLYRKAVEF
ncbi:MAG: DUF2189 domain-containing protein [Inquilinus sp.]|nr:DUF2189 domain-containing protein [Inquilinus sp.]